MATRSNWDDSNRYRLKLMRNFSFIPYRVRESLSSRHYATHLKAEGWEEWQCRDRDSVLTNSVPNISGALPIGNESKLKRVRVGDGGEQSNIVNVRHSRHAARKSLTQTEMWSRKKEEGVSARRGTGTQNTLFYLNSNQHLEIEQRARAARGYRRSAATISKEKKTKTERRKKK